MYANFNNAIMFPRDILLKGIDISYKKATGVIAHKTDYVFGIVQALEEDDTIKHHEHLGFFSKTIANRRIDEEALKRIYLPFV